MPHREGQVGLDPPKSDIDPAEALVAIDIVYLGTGKAVAVVELNNGKQVHLKRISTGPERWEARVDAEGLVLENYSSQEEEALDELLTELKPLRPYEVRLSKTPPECEIVVEGSSPESALAYIIALHEKLSS